jgi:hypothetical protein
MSSTWLTRRDRRSLSATTMLEELLALRGVHLRVVTHQLGKGADRRQRRAQLVRHRRHEVVLEPVQALELAVQRAHLRRLVEQAQHVVRRQRLLLHHGRDHRARRRAADGAGQLRLHELHQARVGHDAVHAPGAAGLRVVGQQAVGRGRAEDARGHAAQRVDAGAAAPQCGSGAVGVGRAPHRVDETQRLGCLQGVGRARQRHRHVQADVGQQAPEQRMGQAVQPGQAEQLFRAQQPDAKGSRRHEAGVDPARLGDRRQHQRPGPQREAGPQARPARRRACRPSSTCRPAARARTAPPRRS